MCCHWMVWFIQAQTLENSSPASVSHVWLLRSLWNILIFPELIAKRLKGTGVTCSSIYLVAHTSLCVQGAFFVSHTPAALGESCFIASLNFTTVFSSWLPTSCRLSPKSHKLTLNQRFQSPLPQQWRFKTWTQCLQPPSALPERGFSSRW